LISIFTKSIVSFFALSTCSSFSVRNVFGYGTDGTNCMFLSILSRMFGSDGSKKASILIVGFFWGRKKLSTRGFGL